MDPDEAEQMFLEDLSQVLFREAMYPHKLLEHRTFKQLLDGRSKKFKPKKNMSGSMLYLVKRATECDNSAGCDALFHLLGFAMKRPEFNVKTLFFAFETQCNCLDKVLKIFLDFFIVKEVFSVEEGRGRPFRGIGAETLLGAEEAVNCTAKVLKVVWTDGRMNFVAPGGHQHCRGATEVVERTILELLRSRSSTDVLILRKVKESLKDLNLKGLTCVQASSKFCRLLELLTVSVQAAATDGERGADIEYIKLSRQVLKIVLLKLTPSSNTTNAETVHSTIFAEWLLEQALKSPLWWSQVSIEIEHTLPTLELVVVDPQPSSVDTSTVHVKLKKYIACMPEEVAKHVLDSVYERLESLAPRECALVFEIMCGIVGAAETKMQHGLLKSQPQHFWSFIAQHYLQVTALPNVQNTVQILANRTSVNVLTGLFNTLQMTPEEDFFIFCISMCTHNLRLVWTMHLTKTLDEGVLSTKSLDDLLCCVNQAGAAAAPVHLEFIRVALSLIEMLLTSPRVVELGEDAFEKCIKCMMTQWTSKS